MKKIIILNSLLLGALFLTGCSHQKANYTQPIITTPSAQTTIEQQTLQQNNQNEKAEEKQYFTNKELGIRFVLDFIYKSDDLSDDLKGKLTVQNNKIIYKYPNTNSFTYIALFTKKENQTIEDAILEIIQNESKDIRNCRVVNKGEYWANQKYTEYVLDLANPNISYSKAELDEIKLADIEAKKNNGPFDGEWKKKEIYNKRLVENCSEYAEPLGLGTSKSIPSHFIYNNKARFVFLPGSFDPSFYQEDSIELFD